MTLSEIVEQLQSCGYVCEAGPLENNVAFIELVKMIGGMVMDDRQNEPIWDTMKQLLILLQDAKPTDRSEIARCYAVTITELEKVMGYYSLWVYQRTRATEGGQ